MKLYYAPGACSLATHIALTEAGLRHERIRVEIPTRRTETGLDFAELNPKGYVPALVLDDGNVLTENVAILDWIAGQDPTLGVPGPLGRSRLVEMLAFISTEIHKPFIRLLFPSHDAETAQMREALASRFDLLAARLQSDYLFGDNFTVADAFLYVMLRWSIAAHLLVPPPLSGLAARVSARPMVRMALEAEGL